MKFIMQPQPWDNVIEHLVDAGHEYTENLHEADFLIWNGGPGGVPDPMPDNIGFVQFVYAGVDALLAHGAIKPGVRWANAAGVFARPVAETGMALLLGALHNYKAIAVGAFEDRWAADAAQNWLFLDHTVAIIGAGGIGQEMIAMLKPFGCRIIAVNRSGRDVPGADETYAMKDADEVWSQADSVVLITPLTDETRGMVNADTFQKMKKSAVLVNIGRGQLVNTDDMVAALRNGEIAGAAMDVVDPEPLPEGHPLYSLPNAFVSPHIAATGRISRRLIAPQIEANAAAFERGEKMPTEVDAEAGY